MKRKQGHFSEATTAAVWLLLAIVFIAGPFVLLLSGCHYIPRPATHSTQGYGAASTTHTDADGNTTVTITPPTPADEALAAWVKYGAIMAVAGLVLMTPWLGGNVRTGGVVALGGVGMAATGKILGDVTLVIPVWFLPSLALLLAAGMLWGWHVREQQGRASAA